MRPFVTTAGLLLALVVAINGVAAWERARRDDRLHAAAAALRPGLAVLVEGPIDERRFQAARLEVIPRPRWVAFGSSRVRDVSGAIAGAAPGEFYNLGMSGATVEDYIALWSLLVRQGKIPEVAVFSVDAWILSSGHEQVRWLALAPDVIRFLDASGTGHRPLWLAVQASTYWWLKTRELVSYTVLQRSLQDLERGLAGRKRQGDDLVHVLLRDVVLQEDVAGRGAIRADGSLIRARAMEPRSAAQLAATATEFVASGAYALRDFRWDADRAHHLDLLWADMRRHGVKLLAYMPPYHPTAWTLLRANREYAAALDQSATFLRALAQRTDAPFRDFSDPASVPCRDLEFYDAHHARPSCLARIWSHLRS
jgi:hypothetical protein